MIPLADYATLRTRRYFFRECGLGLGAAALAALDAKAAGKTHHAPKAKRVIYLHMAGAPSVLDMFDPKPKLTAMNGKQCPDEYIRGQQFAFLRGTPKLLGSPHAFAKAGKSGMELSAIVPKLATVADDITLVRSMYTDQFNHAPAQLMLHTGSPRLGRPSMGSWVSYGLGSENENLPSFVVLVSSPNAPDGGASLWGSGFLPTVHQGVQFRSQGEPVLFLNDPDGMTRGDRRRSLDTVEALNKMHLESVGDPEILTRIKQYELAFRMQTSVPEVADISKEPKEVLERYGAKPGERSYANNCLLARRLVQNGVRFVQLFHWGWDQHGESKAGDIRHGLVERSKETDQANAALITDLKRLGLLEDTLVVWGGEFGRTPMNEERNGSTWLGRDHNQHAFSIWMAGGGVKSGYVHGATDDLGYHAVQDKVHVHDLQATILHLLGLDHEKLTYRSQGRDFRLTDVHGEVVKGLLA